MSGCVRILVAEADEARRADLLFAAIDEGVVIEFASTAADAATRLTQANDFAAAVIALELPDGDGLALIARLRAGGLRTPLLLAADQPTDQTVVQALDAGASDLMAYPFRPAVLRARMRAQLRGFAAADDRELAIGPYRFDTETKTLRDPRIERPIRLTEKEAALLRYLHRAGSRPVSRDELLREVWGYSRQAASHTVATHIHRLRTKLAAGALRRIADGERLIASDERGYWLDFARPPLAARAAE